MGLGPQVVIFYGTVVFWVGAVGRDGAADAVTGGQFSSVGAETGSGAAIENGSDARKNAGARPDDVPPLSVLPDALAALERHAAHLPA
jgi:hypothetical protein